ncbi:MAG TPA: Cof-type HAD-IIB family hydrolase [Solirubrobacteraceae bacterium]|nr:Cof-type HAD-IIB family hydrolase [Solirubrobacteraceae bacterium]
MSAGPADKPQIELVLADVDGTLVTSQKRLTDRTVAAVRALKDAGVKFAVTSGRPPRGMQMLVEPLALSLELAAFNGGLFARPDMTVIEERSIDPALVSQIVALIGEHQLDVWLYRGADWLLRDPHAPHVAKEADTVRFSPTVVEDLKGITEGIAKIVGVSDDLERVAKAEADARAKFGDHVSAARSQPYYLDVTHPDANKGAVVRHFSREYGVPTSRIATLGDMPNDVLMFAHSGLSIAMGNASPEVQRAARKVTASNDDEGFAKAIEQFVLGTDAQAR